MLIRFLILVQCVACYFFSSAQESPFEKFGKVSVNDLQKKSYPLDPEAKAIILSDIGDISVEGNLRGWFSVLTHRHQVVHILNKSGYDLATVEVPLYSNGQEEEKLSDLKAVTYNLEGTKLVETKLDRGSVITEKRSRNLVIKKFTMPNVKEGSIIEFQYRVESEFISQIDPWLFQGNAPRIWSELRFNVPEFFRYRYMTYGNRSFTISDTKTQQNTFRVSNSNVTTTASQAVSFQSDVTRSRWVLKDVPEMKEEKFTSTLKNHLSRIEFQLVSQTDPLQFHNYITTWPALTKQLLESESFGQKLNSNNGWLKDEMKEILGDANTDIEKAKRIFTFVRDHFTCTKNYGLFADENLKTVFKSKRGKSVELNLLLIAMLKQANLEADPVILSTTDNGYPMDLVPNLQRFNYVICQYKTAGKTYYLDASQSKLGFGKLLPNCYNGNARIVNFAADQISLMPESLQEVKKVEYLIFGGPNKEWIGHVRQTPGYFESYSLRGKISEHSLEQYLKDVEKDYGSEYKVEKFEIDSLDQLEHPLSMRYLLRLSAPDENIIYFSPMLKDGYKKNPFTAEQRFYPVEMPYGIDEMYSLTIDIPEGYQVEELPKAIKAKYDEDGENFFDFQVQQSGTMITVYSRIRLKRVLYEPDEYQFLREFFNLIVKKHGEQIIFKKKA